MAVGGNGINCAKYSDMGSQCIYSTDDIRKHKGQRHATGTFQKINIEHGDPHSRALDGCGEPSIVSPII